MTIPKHRYYEAEKKMNGVSILLKITTFAHEKQIGVLLRMKISSICVKAVLVTSFFTIVAWGENSVSG